MILYIVQWLVIYTVLIFLLHTLYLFFQNNLTTTKIKDYYNTFAIESSKINNSVNDKSTNDTPFLNNLQINSTNLDDLHNDFNKEFNKEFNTEFNNNNNNMKSELNDFLSKLNHE